MKVDTLFASQCILGESPLWHAAKKCCYWVDIEKGILYEYNWLSQKSRTWQFNEKLPLVLEGENNQLILALNNRIATFDPDSETLTPLLDIEPPGSGNRCNDGACDTLGRLWIGTMHLQQKKEAGALYMVDKKHEVRKKIPNTSISNGIVWSLDNTHLYYIDSPTQNVQSFMYDEKTANIIFEKNIIHIPTEMGSPDGMTIDQEGMLWIAHWGGFGVYRWNPQNGKLLDKITLPVPQPTSCAFAGENLDHLIITSASEGLTQEEHQKYPESGNVFIVETSVKGVSANKCFL